MTGLLIWLRAHVKALEHLAGAVIVLALPAITGGAVWGHHEWLNFAVLALGQIYIFVGANLEASSGKYLKGIVAAGSAAFVALNSLIAWPPTTTEWAQVGVAVLAALGVLVTPTTAPRAVQASGPGQLGDGAGHDPLANYPA